MITTDTILCQQELYEDCAEEAQALWQAYSAEFSLPIAPRDSMVLDIEAAGGLANFTMRRADTGQLVGIWRGVFMVSRYTGGRILAGDGWYVLPDYRFGRDSIKLLRLAEQYAKDHGCEAITQASAVWHDIGVLLDREGYGPEELRYRKVLR